jgi:transcriptional antiterminator RfaH
VNSTISDNVRWYCLRSQPKHEHIAAIHLRQMDEVEVFCPRIRFEAATRRGKKWFEEALFPGYLFARFPLEELYRRVRAANGVSAILQFGNRYATLDDAVIEALKAGTNAKELTVVQTDVRQGESVRIVDGTVSGLEAVVTQVLSGKERIGILLNFLGREIHAEVAKSGVLSAVRHPLRNE